MLVEICGGDKCVAVNADPSHCWEGESWETRFLKVARASTRACEELRYPPRRAAAHDGRRLAEARDAVRRHSFGRLDMMRYVELLVHTGFPQRYFQVMGKRPLAGCEAESAYRDLDATSANGIAYVRDNLCFPLAAGSFEEEWAPKAGTS